MIYEIKRVVASLGATLIALAMGKPAIAGIFYNSSTGHYYQDGGVAYGSFEVKIPEPGSVFGLLTFGALSVGSRVRKRKT
ncbi:MAG: PEP-CTERM sorting domain-containing protein [Okeania sp. SIO3B3]|nr:PEP-CTERM sorting domain-containing protein [Okeania sp. SIO3B3]